MGAARRKLRDLASPPGEAPAPRRVALDLGATPAQVAAAALPRSGVWLDGGDNGAHSIPLSSLGVISARDGQVEMTWGAATTRLELDPFAAVDLLLECLGSGGASACPRLFGFLGYDLGALIEDMPSLPPPDRSVPDMWLTVCDVWLEGAARPDGTVEWVVCSDDAWRSPGDLNACIEEFRDAIERPPPSRDGTGADVISRPDEREYCDAVRRTVERIHAGDLFEANICRRLEVDWVGAAWPLYERLRAYSPAEYGAYLEVAGWAVLSVSPELFLKVRAGSVETRPIKGTRRRGGGAEEDAELVAELLGSEKEAAELAMIVDLARNDLGRVCAPGTVSVRAHREVVSLASVHHTFSVVTGELAPGTTVQRLLRAAFPPGSITGAPKIEAMRVAYAEEPCRRGVAMGSIGWLDPRGDMELSVAIRTATLADGIATYHAGCGIVAESDPQAELDETAAKARPFLQAVGDG